MDRMEYDWLDRLWADTIGRSTFVHRLMTSYLDDWGMPGGASWLRMLIYMTVLVLLLVIIVLFSFLIATSVI